MPTVLLAAFLASLVGYGRYFLLAERGGEIMPVRNPFYSATGSPVACSRLEPASDSNAPEPERFLVRRLATP